MKQAAGVLLVSGSKILGFQRADGSLGIPCGKREIDELLYETALRELREETGIIAEIDWKAEPFISPMNSTKVTVFKGRDYKESGKGPSHPEEGQPVWVEPEVLKSDSVYGEFNTRMLKHFGIA